MLKSINLKNFRSHKQTYLSFCNGINGIIGLGSSGKTNILRAIKLIFTNRPLGDGYIGRFAKTKEMMVETTWEGAHDDIHVDFKKTGKQASYKVNNKEFRKFGNKVPVDVVSMLNLSDINFHGQFEGPFLIFAGPGEISRTINATTGAEDFDIWISNCSSRIHHLRSALKDADYRVARYTQIREKLSPHYTKLRRWVVEYKRIEKNRVKLQKDFDDLTEWQSLYLSYQHRLAGHTKIARLERKMQIIQKLQVRIDELNDTADLLEGLADQTKLAQLARSEHRRLVAAYTVKLRESGTCPTCYSPIQQSIITKVRDELNAGIE